MKKQKTQLNSLRTWIEIDSRAAKRNYDTFRKTVSGTVFSKKRYLTPTPTPKLWSVVKSNAYGHGLVLFAKLMQKFGIDGFCVDSLVEGIRLRKEGIKKPILVLGPTLPALYREAAKNKITITISNFDALKALADPSLLVDKKSTRKKKLSVAEIPEFHIKIDTGMHRQGFYPNDLPKVVSYLKSHISNLKNNLTGLYTHFASAKDINYPGYTEKQFAELQKAIKLFEDAGFKNLMKHAAATGGTLISPKYHLDAVRVGIGLYGLWPSKELETQLGDKVKLAPVLSWKTVASEVKNLKRGDYVGYDLVERAPGAMKMAVLPIGYWHGFPRSLSGAGEVIINGHRSRVLGRVSMDLTVVVFTHRTKPGNIVTIIGRDGFEEISAGDVAAKSGTVHYEFLTRLNPLIERIVI